MAGYSKNRNKTLEVNIGGLPLGNGLPVRIQSMANTHTSDIHGSVRQCIRIARAGADYVRLTVPSLKDVENIAVIKKELEKKGIHTPVIADVHFNPEIALKAADYVDKVRINPGNYKDFHQFDSLIHKCRNKGVAIRIGVNHGSLSEQITEKFGDTPFGMAESAMEFLRICKKNQFDQVVVSMKSSNVRVMVQATRLIVKLMRNEDMYFPVHLGVTEAGEGEDGRIKSAAGIGTLLAEGIGDTIRVSLTEDPENEISVARTIVDYIEDITGEGNQNEWRDLLSRPTDFHPRMSTQVNNIGGNNVPVVAGSDVINWNKITTVNLSRRQLTDDAIRELNDMKESVLVYNCTVPNIPLQLKKLRSILDNNNCSMPVIFKLQLNEKEKVNFQLKATVNLAGAFIDGFGNGIWLENALHIEDHLETATSFSILQACRTRFTKTEYIACPSCGRTHFNLMETLNKIKSATSHLKNLKIGVMGCIVNGPGEMADADYGYVGSGRGKIALYKGRAVMKKNIPEGEAVKELTDLIKENGDWNDP